MCAEGLKFKSQAGQILLYTTVLQTVCCTVLFQHLGQVRSCVALALCSGDGHVDDKGGEYNERFGFEFVSSSPTYIKYFSATGKNRF